MENEAMKVLPIVVLAVLAGFAVVCVPGIVQHQQLEPGLRVSNAVVASSNSAGQTLYNVTVANSTSNISFVLACTSTSNLSVSNSDVVPFYEFMACNNSNGEFMYANITGNGSTQEFQFGNVTVENVTLLSAVPLYQSYTPISLLLWPLLVLGLGMLVALVAYVSIRRATFGL